MSQIEKLLARFRKNPASIKYRDIERILLYCDFEKIETKGSHVKFKHSDSVSDIVIPVHNNECKPFYKKLALEKMKGLK